MSRSTTTRVKATQRRSAILERVAFLGPGFAFMAVLVVVPLLIVLSYAFFRRGRFGGVVHEFTVDNISRAFEPVYRQVMVDSVVVAGIATVLALLIGYPTAYAVARLGPRARTICLLMIVIPFWTSFLIRTYAWIVLLSTQGVVNDALVGSGIIEDRLSMLNTRGASVVGLVYAYLPLMILPIFASVSRLDADLREAAGDLGASQARTFLDVTLPLSLPGVVTGCIFVFVPSLGNFVIPELLGGGKTVMVGNLVRDQFLVARDWPFGATLALVMVLALLALFAVQSLVSRRFAVSGR